MRVARWAWFLPVLLLAVRGEGAPVRARRLPAGPSIGFVENRGQRAGGSAYYLAGRDATIEVGATGLTYRFRPGAGGTSSAAELRFVEPSSSVRPEGEDLRSTRVHHLVGPPGAWRTDLRTYGRVVHRDLWPGIDLTCTAGEGRLKQEFLVRPGADPARIRLRWTGIAAMRTGDDGALTVDTARGPLRQEAPYTYQSVDGAHRVVASAYALGEGGEYGFALADFDRTRPLVVDPVEVVYATFLGAARADRVNGVAVDATGAAYVTGVTTGTALDPLDAFVAKVAPDGKSVVYWTTIGGRLNEEGRAIAVDGGGHAYVAGFTASSDFACVGGPDASYGGGVTDAFVAKLKPDGSGLVFAGYLGGARRDFAEGIAVGADGSVHVEGPTTSDEKTFPVVVGPDLTHNGKFDLFVAKVAPDGSRLVYAGYVGGDADDLVAAPDGDAWAAGVALDARGALCVAGMTTSTEKTFPTGTGFGEIASWDRTHNGNRGGWGDAFAVRVKPDGTGLEWAGYVGGTGADEGSGIAVDAEGNAYLAGAAGSDETSFPTGEGFGDLPGFARKHGGGDDAFVVKIRADGTKLLWATYFGTPRVEQAKDMALGPAGELCVVGVTDVHGGADAFLFRLSGDGTRLLSSGYVGGTGMDFARAVACDGAGNAYVVGETSSTEESFPDGGGMSARVGAHRTSFGDLDGYLVKVSR